MTDKIMMDGEPLEVGDEVYCLHRGEGEIIDISNDKYYPIIVSFKSDFRDSYTVKFKRSTDRLNRDLYWQKPEIIPPPKPKKKVKVWDWFVEFENEIIARTNGKQPGFFEYRENIKTIQKIDGTEREVER